MYNRNLVFAMTSIVLLVAAAAANAQGLTVESDGQSRITARRAGTPPQSPLRPRADLALAESRHGRFAELATPRRLDIDGAVDRAIAGGMMPATPMLAARLQAGSSSAPSGSPVIKWLGVGLMGLGGIVGWDGIDCGNAIGYGNSLCARRLAFGGGLVGGGLYLFMANR